MAEKICGNVILGLLFVEEIWLGVKIWRKVIHYFLAPA
jgi:hypothetical protein